MSIPTPAQVIERLQAIDDDLAERMPRLEESAQAHYLAKREREKQRAEAYLGHEGGVTERRAIADQLTATVGNTAEAEYESVKAAVKVLEARATIGQSLLKAMERGA